MAQDRALITGGSVGIGAALADVFAGRGHDLILVSRNGEKLGQTAVTVAARQGKPRLMLR